MKAEEREGEVAEKQTLHTNRWYAKVNQLHKCYVNKKKCSQITIKRINTNREWEWNGESEKNWKEK